MTKKAVSFRNFSFQYTLRPYVAVKDFSADINRGDFIVFSGPNGSGKSTLCYGILGLIPNFYAGEMKGKIEVLGLDTKNTPIQSIIQYVAYIPQRIGSSFITPYVLTELSFSLEKMEIGRKEISKKIKSIINEFNIAHLLHRNPQTLSDGEKQLITILSATLKNPEIVVADEPLSNLDRKYRQQVLSALMKLKEEGKTIIVATNEPQHYAELADHIYELEMSQKSQAAISETEYNISHSLKITESSSGTTVKLQNVSFSYSDHFHISDLSITFLPGQIVAIIGDNGVGKTTLLRLIAGLLHPNEGYITYNDKDIRKLKWHKIAKKVGFIFQNPERQILERSVVDEVSSTVRHLYNQQPNNIEIQQALSFAMLRDYSTYHPQSLSFGEKRRLSVLSAIFHNPDIILIDEVTNGLDNNSIKWVTNLIKQLKKLNKTIIIVSHDDNWVKELADDIYLINNGSVSKLSED